ncbi:MAG: DNA gyrase C-terminal beta-propeller domain-containing protein, partial [Sphingomicrobium sp.]
IESPLKQRNRLKKDLGAVREKFGDARRTLLQEAKLADAKALDWSAMIEKEPITVMLSQRGWVRAMKGHVALAEVAELKWREGDGPRFAFHAQTTDRLLLLGEDGRAYTLSGDRLPGGRGFGEPVRLTIDLPAEVEIAHFMVVRAGMKLLVASSDGRGFVTSGEAVMAETRKGKQLVNLRLGAKVAVLRPVPEGADAVVVIGENRKMLLFPFSELPEMARGAGVQLQRYRDGGLSDVAAIRMADGLSWALGGDSGRTRTESDLTPWRAVRGAGGRMAPVGFPRSGKFS